MQGCGLRDGGFEKGYGALLIADQTQGLGQPCGPDSLALILRLGAKPVDQRQIIRHVLEGVEHGLAVILHDDVPLSPRRIDNACPPPPIEDWQICARSDRPEAIPIAQKPRLPRILKPQGSADRDLGKEGFARETDKRVRFSDPRFCGGNVRTPL